MRAAALPMLLTIVVMSVAAQESWTDDPIVPGQTPVKAVHFTELRTRINDRLIGCGGAYSFTDPTLTAGVTPVRAVHLTELREALDTAYAACGRPRPVWSDPALRAGATIRAVHIAELRAAVAALRDPGATAFTLSGTVRDGRTSGPVLAGATVRIEGGGRQESTRADRDGRYRFRNLSGTVAVTATAEPSYVASTIEVMMDRHRGVDFDLRHTGRPPFGGTVWISPDVISPADPTSLRGVTYAGRGLREFWDRPAERWVTIDVYRFDVRYAVVQLEFQVHPDFGSVEAARLEVDTYAPVLGRLPAALLAGAREVEITAVDEVLQGNEAGIFHVYTGAGEELIRNGFLEEVFFHEGAHASLDRVHRDAAGWRTAQQQDDGVFISTYARDHPQREDVAESILPYFAVRYRPERLTDADRLAILTAIPNRLAYFDEQGLDMSPYTATASFAPVLGPSSLQPQRIWRAFEAAPTPP